MTTLTTLSRCLPVALSDLIGDTPAARAWDAAQADGWRLRLVFGRKGLVVMAEKEKDHAKQN